MTPAARLQAAIDLLDEVIAATRENGPAADTLIVRYFKTRRYAGSKDRRAVRDLVYRAIRRSGERPETGRAAAIGLAMDDPALALLFDGSAHGPALLADGETGAQVSGAPPWLLPLIAAEAREEMAQPPGRAPLHLRVNALVSDRDAILAELPDATPIAGTSHGIALPEGTQVEALDAFARGALEVQDAGSQIIVAACGAAPGMTVLDLCAGAGGKTLALAAEMRGKGRLIAADTVRDRLSRLAPRAQRAGAADLIETLLLDGGREAEQLSVLASQCDVVLVDAPCTGSGTWRRNPEARWRLTPERLDGVVRLQQHVLELAAPLVKPGGALVFAVCSLIEQEGADQIARFLARHQGWTAEPAGYGREGGPGELLTPEHDGTDGFFFARVVKPC
ncbi:RsmB/NOP family class I SAM-dependent RNA methyltransferase [Sphingobium sp. CR28]|uniref:RsmB/NOP family class I SAM-dependent RNA methyltransferase n=1 Tax=Sphingobium sp. CR28 TaxID=3400272 RepID=UPI003FEF0A64